MDINWLTVTAQIVNFLVLVWLLQRFLYKPIIRAMDRREQRVADRLNEAKRKSEAAEREAQSNREEREKLDAERDRLLKEAREDADDLRKSLSAEVRREMEEKKRKWANDLQREADDFLADVRKRIGQHVVSIARRTLSEMASTDLEQQMAEVFIDQLRTLDEQRKKQLAEALDGSGLVVRSTFDLPAAHRRRLTRAIHEEVSDRANVEYQTTRDGACGIELRAGSHVIAWSIDGYLDAIDARFAELIRTAAPTEELRNAG